MGRRRKKSFDKYDMKDYEAKKLMWVESFQTYTHYFNKCKELIDKLKIQKENLNEYIKNQDKDDLLFYKSMIDGVVHYYNSKLFIYKKKLFHDLTFIYKKLNDEVYKINCFEDFKKLMTKYIKISQILENNKKNISQTINWVKDDKLNCIKSIEEYIFKSLEYHNKLIKHLHDILQLESNFHS